MPSRLWRVSNRACLWLLSLSLLSWGLSDSAIAAVEGGLPAISGWRLQGIFSASHGSGIAQIQLNGAARISVRSGDQLPEGIVVQAILPDRVLLQRGAQRAELLLKGASPSTAVTAVLSSPEVATAQQPNCEEYAGTGVPLDELVSLGLCAP